MIAFNQLPDHARVWVYQSNRFFTDDEVQNIQLEANRFVASWNSHGKDLQAGIQVFNNLHIVVAVDENHASASGWSIDKSVKFIQAAGDALKVDFFDRLLVALKTGEDIKLIKPTDQDSKAILNQSDIKIFDNLIQTKGDLDKAWLKPVADTWVGNYIN